MSRISRHEIIQSLLELHGRTFAEELGIMVQDNRPESFFRLLCAVLLFSTRISAKTALHAAKAIGDRGWTSPEKMLTATWEERVKALDSAGYVRYDERTATRLAEMAHLVIDKYGGDVRTLRDKAGCNPQKERALVAEFKGIGDVGANIFFREVQGVWEEDYPFADERALKAARRLGLPETTDELARLVQFSEFPRLVAALVRVDLEDDYERVKQSRHASAYA
ncbi:MAG: hypothetical protein A2293_10305 [Elusimicrobia bacterium RIFOXYB2_FULL_49_7]|nr:MAG: hypothetical protein A2293_10305 [Elusimicrobia bacterium RIFOXYB2_FULL_49_7]